MAPPSEKVFNTRDDPQPPPTPICNGHVMAASQWDERLLFGPQQQGREKDNDSEAE